MDKWSLIAYLGTATVGVLSFLRLVSNEIDVVERESVALRTTEVNKHKAPMGEVWTDDPSSEGP